MSVIDITPSDDIWRLDRDHVVHPWTHFDSFRQDGSLVLDRAEGVYIYDRDSKRYLDGVGGLWCVNIGYGREEMASAIADQALKMAYANPFVDVTNAPAARLAGKLADLAPGDLNHVIFTCGGSTANDSALRLIHYYWGCRDESQRRYVLTRRGSYHGSTYITQSLTGKPADRQPEFRYADDIVRHVSEPNAYRPPEGVAESVFEQFLIDEFEATVTELGPETIAAHYAEPILGAGGVVVPPVRYAQETRAICERHGILYVADEVVTAFGRVGGWFASKDVFDIQPDIIVCAKGLTSGYQPLGAAIFSDAIYETIAAPGHDRWFTNGYTYSGHPVACAAALANIGIIEREGLPARGARRYRTLLHAGARHPARSSHGRRYPGSGADGLRGERRRQGDAGGVPRCGEYRQAHLRRGRVARASGAADRQPERALAASDNHKRRDRRSGRDPARRHGGGGHRPVKRGYREMMLRRRKQGGSRPKPTQKGIKSGCFPVRGSVSATQQK